MDGDLMLILGFTLAALWIIFRQPRHREQRRSRDQRAAEAAAEREASAEVLEKLARLEERIKVLERIVTDDPQELRRQFRDLGG